MAARLTEQDAADIACTGVVGELLPRVVSAKRDRFRAEADQLRGAIQQQLLAAARGIEQSSELATIPRQ